MSSLPPSPSANSAAQPKTLGVADSKIWLVSALVSLGLLLFIRNPFVVVNPQFFHEDVVIFFSQQRVMGSSAIFHPYAGYLHLFPRLVACVASGMPLEATPLIYLIFTYVAWGWTAYVLATSSAFSSFRWGALAAVVWATVPTSGEMILNLTNVQWALAVGLVVVLAENIAQKTTWNRALFVSVSALTGPFSAVLAPLALLRLWTSLRQKHRVDPIASLCLVFGLVQLIVLFLSSVRAQQAAATDLGLFALALSVVALPDLFGTLGTFPQDIQWRLMGSALGVTGVLWSMGRFMPGSDARRRMLLGTILLLAAGTFICLGAKLGVPTVFGNGSRYLSAPGALFILVLISGWSFCPPRNFSWIIPTVLLALIIWRSSQHFTAPRYPLVDWADATRKLKSGQPATIAVPPFQGLLTLPPDPQK